MKLVPKREMSRLIWSFTIPVFLLVAIIIGFFLVDGIVRANNNAKHFKELMIKQTIQSYGRLGGNFQNVSFDPWKVFNPETLKSAIRGDLGPMYGLIKDISFLSTPAEYVAIIVDGKVYDYTAKPGVKINPKKLRTSPPPNNYMILKSFGGLRGTLANVFYTMDLSKAGVQSKFYVSAVYDLTKQVAEIDSYFSNQKNDTIITLIVTGILAFILFGLLSTFWLRYLIRKYVSRPVEKLNTMAEDISAGTFKGEVVVDPNSDFAALQGLLKSGQLILREHDKQLGEKG